MKKGREEVKSAARPGRSHWSLITRGVGWEGQEKRWAGVWGDPQRANEGQSESGALLTLCRKLLREGGTEAAGEKFLLLCHRWRRGEKDLVGRAGRDRSGDRLRVQGLEGRYVLVRGDDASHGVRSDNREGLFLEGLSLVKTRPPV